jgi:glycosyltransferase involved in cell wall biosynthesis
MEVCRKGIKGIIGFIRMNLNSIPRILVVAIEPINMKGPTGITLSNLFGGWPKDRLAQIYVQEIEPDAEICSQTFQLVPRFAPCGYYVRRLLGKQTFRSAPGTPGLTAIDPGTPIGARACLHMVARGINDASPLMLPKALKDWVRRFSPDVIYSPLGSIRVMKLFLAIAKISERPIIPHFMDDWPLTMYSGSVLLGYPRRVLRRCLAHIFQRSPFGLCIGEEMAQEYQQRYGITFGHVMNCVDETCFIEPKPRKSKCPSVSYIGRLHLDRWQPLVTIGRAAIELGYEMRIFAPAEDLQTCAGHFRDIDGIRLGSLPPEEVFGELQRADVLVHVESFDPAIIAYTRFSVSTKIPQYMAAGKPILAYGPEDLASMGVIRSANAGVVIGRNEQEEVRMALRALLEDQSYGLVLAQNGYSYARTYYAKGAVQEHFRAILAQAAAAQCSEHGLHRGS